MTKYYDAGDVDLDEEVVLDSNGNRITEARAQEMAEDAIHKVRGGRPSLSGGNIHSPTLQARVSERTHQQVHTIAEQRGINPSDVVREAVEKLVEASS